MFERFTKDARLVVTLAVEEAQNRSDARIGNEHLLLGVAGSGGGPADLDLAELRFELDRLDWRALEAVGIDPGILDVGASRSRERSGKPTPALHACRQGNADQGPQGSDSPRSSIHRGRAHRPGPDHTSRL